LKPLGWVVLLLLSLRSWQCSNGRPFSCCSRFIVSEHETLSFFPIYTWYQHSEFCFLDVFVGWRLFSASVMLMEYFRFVVFAALLVLQCPLDLFSYNSLGDKVWSIWFLPSIMQFQI
jgi:hypothetical protein